MKDGKKIIRDPIYGDIKLEGVTLQLLETPEIQRLQNISQLGLANLVFPGAHHTRFEHSLGTLHMASTAAEALNLDEYKKDLITCAAFLHDLGHGPFSHTLESILRETLHVDHVDMTEKLILGNYSIFEKEEKQYITKKEVFQVLEENQIDKTKVVEIIRGIHNDHKYLTELLNSAIDVDQLDYIMRDAYYTGVAYGMVDVERFLLTLKKHKNNLYVERKGIGVIENILMARALMYSSVYFHKTVRIAELMLSKAIELTEEKNPFDFFKMTDGELINYLKHKGKFQEEIATSLKYRMLFKQAYMGSPFSLSEEQKEIIKRLNDKQSKREKEKEIEEKLNIPHGHVIIDIPYDELHESEPRIDQTNIQIKENGQKISLDKITPIPSAIRSRSIPDWMIMVITDEEHRDIVSKNAEKIIFG
ncbi:MAG: HD domain-containing protein [Candidatus Thermoplasmatota archaeon]